MQQEDGGEPVAGWDSRLGARRCEQDREEDTKAAGASESPIIVGLRTFSQKSLRHIDDIHLGRTG